MKKRQIASIMFATALVISVPMIARSEYVWDDTLFPNDVYYEEYYKYNNSVQTNNYANNMPGVVVLTQQEVIFDMLDYTAEEKWGTLPILFVDEYIADPTGDGVTYVSDDHEVVEEIAINMGGEALSLWNINFFRGTGSNLTPMEELPQEIQLCFQINKDTTIDGHVKNAWDTSEYEFSIVRVHDGVGTLLKDLDDNPRTLTINTDLFSTYALMVSSPGEVDAYLEHYQSSDVEADTTEAPATNNTVESTGKVLDSVPKTGEE